MTIGETVVSVGEIATLVGAITALVAALGGVIVKIIYAVKWRPGTPRPPVEEDEQ